MWVVVANGVVNGCIGLGQTGDLRCNSCDFGMAMLIVGVKEMSFRHLTSGYLFLFKVI